MNNQLILSDLRRANIARNAEYPGSKKIDLSFRGLEMAGEAGELANKIKKLVRLQKGISGSSVTRDQLMEDIADEMGDVLITLDLIAMDLDISLSSSTRDKFNKVSRKLNLATRL